MKTCSKCKIEKPETEFHKSKTHKNGLCSQCKECRNQHNLQYSIRPEVKEQAFLTRKIWRENNKKEINIKKKIWRENNKEEIAAKGKVYRAKPEVKSHIITQNKEYRQSPAGKLAEKRKLSTFKGKLNSRMSIYINGSLKFKGSSKGGRHWENLVGYSVQDLIQHLEANFKPGMTWDNYGHGKGKWNIDHDTPVSYFNYDGTDHPEFRLCWGLNNLYPMWSLENYSKCDKLPWEMR